MIKNVISTKNFIPNKINKLISDSENIYTTKNCCILKFSDKNNNNKILKISIYNKDEYDMLTILRHSDNKHLLKPEIIHKKNGLLYAVYPYKTTLIEVIKSDNFNFNTLLNLSLDLCNGLIFLHEKKYLHLDISPDNIYLNDDNSFCIGDYSCVRSSKKQIKHHNLYLTPGYSPPEFTASPKSKLFINELSDEYSLGKSLLSLFQAQNNNEQKETFKSKKEDKITEEFRQILQKACSEIQDFRYSSIYEFKNAISEFKLQNKKALNNIKLYINASDDMFDNLKTQPVKKEYHKICNNPLLSFVNTPFFVTIAILLAVLLPIMTLYNIFFLPHISPISPNEANTTITFTDTASAYKNTFSPTPATYATATVTPDILHLNEFDVKEHIIMEISTNTLKNIAGKPLDNNALKILSANNNSIVDITGIISFQNIEELYISCNKIKNINALSKLKHLKTLVISSNLLEDIYMLSEIKTLENLDLSCNKTLKNITSLRKLKSLRLLCLNETNISQNDISKLKKSLPYCKIID